MSHWEVEVVRTADEDGAKFDTVLGQKEEIERLLDPSWAFDCPVCKGVETFVCELVEDELDKKEVKLLRAVCVECSLSLPRGCQILVGALCKDQIDEKRDLILHEFGVS